MALDKNKWRTKARQAQRATPILEELEPRLLLSADAAGVFAPTLLDAQQAPVEFVVNDALDPVEAETRSAEHSKERLELVFVDTDTPDYQQLVDGILANSDEGRRIEVILLDNSRDGVQQISQALESYRDVDAMHLVSHGSEGSIDLGATRLDTNSLSAHSHDVADWYRALDDSADILIYGCDLAATEDGKQLLDQLAQLTGADIAASDDLTGAARLGGDWELEHHVGKIESQVVVGDSTQAAWNHVLNNAPVLAGANNLTAIDEDPASNPGTLVSDLIAGQISDADGGALEGIAVIGVDDTNGTWEYTTNGGGVWTAFGAVDASSARLLSDDANTRVRFVPDANWNGTVSNGITFHAWDQTSGTAGSTANVSTSATVRDEFGSASYSNDNGSATWAGAWQESGESDGVGSGTIQIAGGELLVGGSEEDTGGRSITREADLSGAVSATLTFDYRTVNIDNSGPVTVEIGYGGGNWRTLATYNPTDGPGSESFDITAEIASDTQIRISHPDKIEMELYVDNLQIEYGGVTPFSSASASSSIVVNPVNDAPFFGAGDGIIETDFGTVNASAQSVIVQPDGKALVGGFADVGGINQFALSRYNADGSPDTTFGSGGQVTTSFGGVSDTGNQLALQDDGKIVFVGGSYDGSQWDLALARYNADGSLDSGFGSGGTLLTDFPGGNSDIGYDVVIQADGKILVGASSSNGSNYDYALARYNTDGTLDTSFSGDGLLTTSIGSADDRAWALALQSDGSILLGGYTDNGSDLDYALLRYDSSGNLDTGFGASGIVITDFGSGSQDVINDLAIQDDGKIVVVGQAGDASKVFSLARYNTDGSLDSSFGSGGTTTVDVSGGNDFGESLAIQDDGKIVVTGRTYSSPLGFRVVRLDADGSLDSSFGTAGISLVETDGFFPPDAFSVALAPDGEILIAGETNDGNKDFQIARVATDGTADSNFDSGLLNANPTFVKGGAAVVLDTDVTIFDAELSAADNFDGATLTLARNGGADADDVFSATGTLGALSEGGNLVVGATTIGSVTTNSAGTLALTFNANATNALVDEAMQQIAYSLAGPTAPASVQIDWTFDDGNTGVQGSGGAMQAVGNIVVDVLVINNAPVITSNGGGAAAAINVAENSTAVTTVTATDADLDTPDYTIVGGADSGAFSLGLNSGVLAFTTAPNFETATDSDGDGIYEVIVQADDGNGGVDTQSISITVTDAAEGPAAAADSVTVNENGTASGAAGALFANDTDEKTITAGATLSFDAASDSDATWNFDLGTAGYDWNMVNFGSQSTHTTSPSTALPGIQAAYQFTGGNGGATMASLEALPGDPTNDSASFEVWFRPAALGGQQIVFEVGGGTNGVSMYLDGNSLVFGSSSSGPFDQVSVDLVTLLGDPTAEFIQAMGVINIANSELELFINGSSVGFTSLTGLDWSGAGTAGLGRANGGVAAGSGRLAGDIAAFRFYEAALTDIEINNNYRAITDALVVSQVNGSGADVGTPITLASGAQLTVNADGSYSYDPNGQFETLAAGASINDSFTYQITDGEGQTSTATATVTINGENDAPTDLTAGTADEGGLTLNADGGNDTYFVADNGSALLGGLGSLTIEATFAVDTPGADLTPLLSYAAGGNDEELALFLKSDGRIWFFANDGGGSVQSTASTYTQLFDGETHHVAVTWDNATGAVDFYVDGVLEESFTGYKTGQTLSAGGELVFGQDQDSVLGGFNTIDVFSGTLHEIRIFDDVRSAGEIAAGYGQTLPNTEAGMIANWLFGDLSTGGVVSEEVSGNNLTLQSVSGGGFTPSTPALRLEVNELAANTDPVGTVYPTDIDAGDTFTYMLTDSAGGRFAIDNSGQVTVANASLLDFETDASHNITVRVTDSGGATYDEVFTVYVTDENEAPTGAVNITGTPTEDQVLTASNTLADDDGLGAISYQWQRDGVDIAGETSANYTLTQADVGSTITVVASYTDGLGKQEQVASAGVGPVANLNDAPQLAAWYNAAWDFRKNITIDAAQVEDDLTDFPVLITIVADTDLAAAALANGDDILFTTADGVTKLSHEIQSYNPATGELTVWVKTDLSATRDTELFLYYGNAAAGNQEDVNGVWSAGYVGVWHLEDAPTGAAGDVADSTAFGNNGNTEGGMNGADLVAGQIGNALEFDEVDDLIRIPDSASLDGLNDEATFEMWVWWDDAADGDSQLLMSSSNRFSDGDGFEWASQGSGNHFFYPDAMTPDTNYNLGPNPFTDMVWHHVAATMNFATKEAIIYVDGAPMAFTIEGVPGSWSSLSDTDDLLWGGNPDRASRFFDGLMDEIRVSDVARSQEWIQTSVNNQSSPATFFTLGGEESRDLTLTTIPENTVSPAGDTVAAILNSGGGDRITDEDAGAVEGIAVTGVDNSNGQWQYDANADGSWVAFGAVSDSSAVLLDAGALIRFVPDTDFNGATGNITFRAWDQTAGSNGQTGVDVSGNGGSTPYSSQSEVASLTVTPVNSAPTGSVSITGTAAEDSTLTASNSLADADGMGAVSYQWQRDGADITGATGSSYTLTQADVGATITVDALYLDGGGTNERVSSAGVGPVANLNDAPTGAVSISGTATEDSTLTASNTLADEDGLGAISYQWQRNGVDITGETGATYTLTQADVGTTISVVASYTDGEGTGEQVSSAGVGPVANLNDFPTGTVSISGTATEDSTLTASNTLADEDGLGAISYQWQRNGVDITGETGATYTLTQADVGATITVVASYTDGEGTGEQVGSAVVGPVANLNDSPTGAVSISGTATEDSTLTASNTLADEDGLGAISYQWQRNGVDITGETGATYTLTQADVGATITVVASYTDGEGTGEQVGSAGVGPVANLNDSPTGSVSISGTPNEDSTLTASNTLADEDGLGAISYQWQRNGLDITGETGATYTLTQADVGATITVVASYTDGEGTAEQVASAGVGPVANLNDAPTGAVSISGIATEDSTLTASNTLADEDGLGAISYQWQRDGVDITGETGATYTLTQADVGATITVVASYTDGEGTAEQVGSAGVGPVANLNDSPTGSVSISGTPTEDSTLTASNTLADEDGLGAISYQWQRNGVDITGETGATYTLTQADVGTTITVVASYTDGEGTGEQVGSAGVGPVANLNDAPTGTVSVSGTATEDSTLTASNTLADEDGLGAISYQWQRNGVDITGETGATYTLTQADVGATITVGASYTDGEGTAEQVASAGVGPVANLNDAPTGAVSISGTATEDSTLTASNTLADEDGLGAISYQWQRNGVDITGETGATYTLTQADVGTTITVVASYTDGEGTGEQVSSAGVGPIANLNDAPTGMVSIDNMSPAEGATLTASNTLADEDGLSGAISYQWYRDGIAIGGATGSTYVLSPGDVGGAISVEATYTDDQGTPESVFSGTTAPVTNTNNSPTGTVDIAGTPAEDQVLTASNTLADADGMGAVSYQWQRDGTDISGATGATYTLGQADVGSSISVVASYVDGGGMAEAISSSALGPVANVNDVPGGSVLISNTAPIVGDTLTASNTLTDEDGLGGPISYQWYRDGVAISGATGATYTVASGDSGAAISVAASYTDGYGTDEQVTSTATSAVSDPVVPAPEPEPEPAIESVPAPDPVPDVTLPPADPSPQESGELPPTGEEVATPVSSNESDQQQVEEQVARTSQDDSSGTDNNNVGFSGGVQRQVQQPAIELSEEAVEQIVEILKENAETAALLEVAAFGPAEGPAPTDISQLDAEIDAVNEMLAGIASRVELEHVSSVLSSHAMWKAIDVMNEEIDGKSDGDAVVPEELVVRVAKTTSVGFFAAIIAYALRGGALLASLISTSPLWSVYDPLPVLSDSDEEKANVASKKKPRRYGKRTGREHIEAMFGK